MARLPPVMVMVRLSRPGPTSDTPLVNVSVLLHGSVPSPAVTLIVSPREAEDTHELVDAKSGVLVHVGLEPVHVAHVGLAQNQNITASVTYSRRILTSLWLLVL